MAKIIKKLKMKQPNGTWSNYIPIGAEAENINVDGESVEDKLGKKPYYYGNVAAMKADTKLKVGDMAITLGHYEANDGGGAEYYISDSASNTEYQLQIGSLYANMIIKDNIINIRQLGGKPNLIEDETKIDNKIFIDIYVSICNKLNKRIKLFIPQGFWFFSPTLISRFDGVNIEGVECFNRSLGSGTILLPLNQSQAYIWKLGGLADYSDTTEQSTNEMTCQSTIKNLIFSTGSAFNGLSEKVITTGLFIIDKCQLCIFDNIYFQHFNGVGLRVRNAWEINWGVLNFRNQKGFNYGCLLFDDVVPFSNVSGNISAFDINYLMFESQEGYAIKSLSKSGFSHNHIGHINIELGFNTLNKADIASNDDISQFIPIDLISGFYRSLIIDSINFFYNDNLKAYNDNNTYYFRSLFATLNTNDVAQAYDSSFAINVGNITWHSSSSNNTSLLYSYYAYYRAKFLISNLLWFDDVPAKPFDLYKGALVSIGNSNNVLNNNSYSIHDAYKFVASGNPNAQLETDSTACSEYGIVVNSHDATINNLFFKNIIGSTLAPKILVKNNTANAETIALRDTSNSNAQKTLSIPANSDWTWYQFESNSNWRINDNMIVILKNCSCAKIIL